MLALGLALGRGRFGSRLFVMFFFLEVGQLFGVFGRIFAQRFFASLAADQIVLAFYILDQDRLAHRAKRFASDDAVHVLRFGQFHFIGREQGQRLFHFGIVVSVFVVSLVIVSVFMIVGRLFGLGLGQFARLRLGAAAQPEGGSEGQTGRQGPTFPNSVHCDALLRMAR